MAENRLRSLLTSRALLVGTFLNFADAALVEFVGMAGFDWILLDAEHEGMSVEKCYDLMRAADAVGLAVVVRVPSSDPAVILPFADTGAHAILAPHVSSEKAARSLVSAVRFPVNGVRGFSATSRAAGYGLNQTASEYAQSSDAHTLPIALIEDAVAWDELDAIIATPGLDIFAVGPSDLAASMGLIGQAQHPQVVDRMQQLTQLVLSSQKVMLAATPGPDQARSAHAAGARMVVTTVQGLLGAELRRFLEEVDDIRGPQAL